MPWQQDLKLMPSIVRETNLKLRLFAPHRHGPIKPPAIVQVTISKMNITQVQNILGSLDLDDLDFLKPMYTRQDSQTTIVQPEKPESYFDILPTEILAMIAMSSGFKTCFTLRHVNQRWRSIVADRQNWKEYISRTPDTIEVDVSLETSLHSYDQLVFGEWTKQGTEMPYMIHKTFLEQYDFLGGITLNVRNGGKVLVEYFDHRERLPCYIADVQKRIQQGQLPPIMPTLDSPVGGLRVPHSCTECVHYDNQEIYKSEFVHGSVSAFDHLEHTFTRDKYQIRLTVTTIRGVFGYKDEMPCVCTKISKINGEELGHRLRDLYMRMIC
ncbi:hypothetical protein HDV01_003428 [Terramyces sp. JEL0728]|nr:hypothetical protein HDV01_003428 [Terramyces sp. JEL0728]